MTTRFSSNVEPTVLLLRFLPVFLYIIFVFLFNSFTTTLPLLIPCIITLAQLSKTNYQLTPDGYLLITFGFSRLEIKVRDINGILLKRNFSLYDWFHTYANSGNGLLIKYGAQKEIIISPTDIDKFMLEIQKLKQAF